MSSAVDDSDGEESSQELEESLSQELACSVHESVWADFYDWEQGYCQNILDNLCRNDHGLKQNTNSALTFTYPEVKFENIARAELNDSMIITRPSLGDGKQAHTKDRDCYTYLAPIVAPIPIYESCTPCVANIVNKERNEANLDLPILHFFPFVDDPSFVLEKYAKLFNAFIWQDDEQRDPDEELIIFESLVRLLQYPGADLEAILTLSLWRPDRLLQACTYPLQRYYRRDALKWNRLSNDEGVQKLQSLYLTLVQKIASDENGRVKDNSFTFCPVLNCVQNHCPTHLDQFGGEGHLPDAQKSSKALLSLASECGPCGDKCFLTNEVDDPDDVIWDEGLFEVLKAVLNHCPDELPCKLSLACHVPCFEIFVQRQKILPDRDILYRNPANVSKESLKAELDKVRSGWPTPSCNHRGPCTKDCICVRNKIYCSRECSCEKDCPQQWRGCAETCKSSRVKGSICTKKESCVCVAAERECQPDLCGPCISVKHTFLVTGIQNQVKPIRIARGSYGFGAFAGESLRVGQFVGEYVGQILDESIGAVHEYLSVKRARNYMFNRGFLEDYAYFDVTQQETVLDAMVLSNETRFPNHSEKRDNCHALMLNVNGDRRIGLVASKRLKRGEELLFNYGPIYNFNHAS